MNLTILVAGLALTANALAANAGSDVTTAERTKAFRYIEETNQALYGSVQGLTDAQWNFKPAPDRWSIAEVVEHIALIQDAVIGNLGRLNTGTPVPEGRDVARLDAEIFAKIPDRTEKVKAPPVALPNGRWTPAAALDHFKEGNGKIRATLETTHDLRSHTLPHPIFGQWDGYQWIIAVAGHTARHTQQILEVKADAGFPTK